MASKSRSKSARPTVPEPVGDRQSLPIKKTFERSPLWMVETESGSWLKFPVELVLCPHEIHQRLRPRHVWLVMRLLAQPMSDHKGDFKIRATWSQLRNAAGRQSATPQDKKLRALKGDPSYDSIRKWAGELKSSGLLTWVPGGKRGVQDVASTFDLSCIVTRVEMVRKARVGPKSSRR